MRVLNSGSQSIKLLVIAIAVTAICGAAAIERLKIPATVEASTLNAKDDKKARAAFSEAVKVFFSARCINCHPAGDGPLQGNESRVHDFEVKRGPDGKGVDPLACSFCHLEANADGPNMPPGAVGWHMPGAERKMVFQGLTAGQLCRNLKDPLQNGGKKSAKDAVEHLATDPKVTWAWTPGTGRTPPPMGRDEFLKKMTEWVASGAACPE
ncbi:MAG: hypothetical protein QM785_06845 [Pyrinomonadaceae bacterium]